MEELVYLLKSRYRGPIFFHKMSVRHHAHIVMVRGHKRIAVIREADFMATWPARKISRELRSIGIWLMHGIDISDAEILEEIRIPSEGEVIQEWDPIWTRLDDSIGIDIGTSPGWSVEFKYDPRSFWNYDGNYPFPFTTIND